MTAQCGSREYVLFVFVLSQSTVLFFCLSRNQVKQASNVVAYRRREHFSPTKKAASAFFAAQKAQKAERERGIVIDISGDGVVELPVCLYTCPVFICTSRSLLYLIVPDLDVLYGRCQYQQCETRRGKVGSAIGC